MTKSICTDVNELKSLVQYVTCEPVYNVEINKVSSKVTLNNKKDC